MKARGVVHFSETAKVFGGRPLCGVTSSRKAWNRPYAPPALRISSHWPDVTCARCRRYNRTSPAPARMRDILGRN